MTGKSNLLSKRTLLIAGGAVLVLLALALGFRDPPALIDSAEVKRAPFRVTVEEEGRTRVVDRYEVSAPVTGHIARVLLEPGDAVAPGDTLFVINPQQATPLDARSRAQAEAVLGRAEAALKAARTLVDAEQARLDLAETELQRMRRLVEAGHMPRDALDRAEAEARRANATLRSALFAVDVARHERDNARATLAVAGGEEVLAPLRVTSPVRGVVLNRVRQSEGAVQAGQPVLSLGNLDSLEVEVDVLSPDAVRLEPGMPVELERWGGDQVLPGRVRRIEPAGFTRVSALGVEEQRVWVIVDIEGERDAWRNLGDGYRIEARFILWEGDEVLQVPASALFRQGDTWGTYVVDENRARYREVVPGRRSGLQREILEGLEPGERVVLHPGQDMRDGARVRMR